MRFFPPVEFPERGRPFQVSSDSNALYTILDVRQRPDGLIEVDTQRVGPSGTSFAERLIDPVAARFAYLRDASSLEDFLQQERTPRSQMAEFVEGSISDLVARHAKRLLLN